MKAAIKGFSCPDDDGLGPDRYKPDDPENFIFLIQLFIGPSDSDDDGESFQVVACTPKYLLEHYGQDEMRWDRPFLIVFEYNFARMMNFIQTYVDNCTGDTWHEIAIKLSRVSYWELEDYRP
ncbi:MAG: Imm8 family immunity protein [Aggregatilineales bacterium]